MNEKFCKFFKNGLVFNNNNHNFTISPCCYFAGQNQLESIGLVREQFTEYKNSWLSADVNKTCTICINQERSGIHSYRQAANDIIKTNTDSLIMLTVAVNKKCNLACPTCGPEASSFWYQENIRNNVNQSTEIIKLHQEDRENIITKNFLFLLENQDLSSLEYIKFGGGEPLMNDTHLRILKLIPDPKNVVIQYTSNFSIMPSAETFKIWKEFKLIKWVASVDGVNEQFEFLRWPYKWDKFKQFKDKAVATVPPNVMFGIEHTLNPLNIFYYDKIEDWISKEFPTNRVGDPLDVNLHYAEGILGLNKIPIKLKKIVNDKYGPTHKISLLLNQLSNESNITEFVTYLDTINSWRNTNWRKIFLEVEQYFV
jgi:hypothetical protein